MLAQIMSEVFTIWENKQPVLLIQVSFMAQKRNINKTTRNFTKNFFKSNSKRFN